MEAWDSGISNLGLAIDKDESKYIFYIGSDSGLRYMASVKDTNFGGWSIYNPLDTEYWPLADEADGDFAVASDPASYEIRIYYMSGGSMTEVSRIGQDAWAGASALPTKATTTVSVIFSRNFSSSDTRSIPSKQASSIQTAEWTGMQKTASSATATPSSDKPSSSSGTGPFATTTAATTTSSSENDNKRLSAAAAAGVGVAATLGILIIAGAIGGCCWRRKTKSRKNKHAQDEVPLSPRQPAGANVYGADGHGAPYDHFASVASAQRGAVENVIDTQGLAGRGLKQATTIPSLVAVKTSTSPSTNVVYVPAHELPSPSPKNPGFSPTFSGTSPVAPSPPSELQSHEAFVPRSIYNQQSRPVTDFSATTVSPTMSGTWDVGSDGDANGRMAAVAHGPMSPLTELSSDLSPNHSSFLAEKCQN